MSDQPKKAPPVQFRAAGVNQPLADAAVLMRDYDPTLEGGRGKMSVSVSPDSGAVTRVFADTVGFGDTGSNAVTAGAVELPKVGGVFTKDDFWVNFLPPDAPFSANRKFCYWGLDGTNAVVEVGTLVAFTAIPNPCTGVVHAKNCIWLTYAPTGQTLAPFGETTDKTSVYLPFGARVPDTATGVRVEVTSAGQWEHGPGLTSDADGRVGTGENLSATHKANYRNATLHSDDINDGEASPGVPIRLNRLVGLWERLSHDTATTEIDIGKDKSVAVSAGAVRLRLGMHDGFEWSNNSGQVAVKITWTA